MNFLLIFLLLQSFFLIGSSTSKQQSIKRLYGSAQYYLNVSKFSDNVAIDIAEVLSNQNIRCIISASDCDSLQMSDFLVSKLPGISWFGIDPKISDEERSCNPEKYATFREKYPVDPNHLELPVRIPLECNRPLIIATEKNLRRMLYDKLPSGLITYVNSDNQNITKYLYNITKPLPHSAYDYLANIISYFIYG